MHETGWRSSHRLAKTASAMADMYKEALPRELQHLEEESLASVAKVTREGHLALREATQRSAVERRSAVLEIAKQVSSLAIAC